MSYQGSIRAVNLLIRDHVVRHPYDGNMEPAARLCSKRFADKFEEPQLDTSSVRRTAAWERWIKLDGDLQRRGLLGPSWAKARLWMRKVLANYRIGDLTFTNGSSEEPLGIRTSVACKLSGVWTITADCFDLFAQYSYCHRALKHAVKKRFHSYCRRKRIDERQLNKQLWQRYKNAAEVYKFKLFFVVKFVRGNRYSTVPKNNSKDRSICLEPFCNMLVQRAIGLGLRRCLRDNVGIDLDTLADVHKVRIRDENVATIDLTDCSDAISMWLITYLLPYRVLSQVSASRSDMTYGLDGNYHVVNKVSSMGNGFTFDLMTLVLTALTRSFDPTSTVFGDDIICQNSVADDVVSSLQVAGFSVNPNKTNIRSTYRESCGAHFIDGYGYVTSFDIRWITSEHELVSCINKIAILAHIYGGPYETLRAKIWTCVPRSLLGAATKRLVVDTGRPPSYDLSSYVRYGEQTNVQPSRHILKVIRKFCYSTHKPPQRISVGVAFVTKNRAANLRLASHDWDIYFQYLSEVRCSPKIKRLVLKSTLVARVDEEQIGFVDSLPS